MPRAIVIAHGRLAPRSAFELGFHAGTRALLGCKSNEEDMR